MPHAHTCRDDAMQKRKCIEKPYVSYTITVNVSTRDRKVNHRTWMADETVRSGSQGRVAVAARSLLGDSMTACVAVAPFGAATVCPLAETA